MNLAKQGRFIMLLVAGVVFTTGFLVGRISSNDPNSQSNNLEDTAGGPGASSQESIGDDADSSLDRREFAGGFVVAVEEQDGGWQRFYCLDIGSHLTIDGMIDPRGTRHGAWNYSPRNTSKIWIEYFWHGTHVGTDDAGLTEWMRRDNQSER